MIEGLPVLSIAEFGRLVESTLRGVFPEGLWVEGEVRGLKPRPHATGHYFALADGSGASEVSINVKLFKRGALDAVLAKMEAHGVPLQNGMRVRFLCRTNFYAKSGELSLIIDDVDTTFALGEIARKRDELIKKLVAGGIDKKNKQRPVPLVPLRIGVVSSTQAAGFIDFRRHLEESGTGFQLLVADVNVQGDRAPGQVAAALAALDRRDDIEVIVVIRGGGSKGDLAAFDEEVVAMAIARCSHPVFTGIGHEIDTSVADEVAFRGLKTPTACAVELVGIVGEFVTRTEDCWREITHRADMVIAAAQATLGSTTQAIRLRVTQAVDRGDHHLTSQAQAVRTRIAACVERAVGRVDRAIDALRRSPMLLDARAVRIDNAAERLRLLDPETTMSRGWSITRTIDGRVVRNAAELSAGAEIVTMFARGSARSRVEETTP